MDKIRNRKISMVMACYNSEPYLDKMLDSILCQTWDEDLELITVNGSSTDNTSAKLAEWVQRFLERGFELYNYELPESNLVDALNEGLKHISGDFICFPDSDDWMHPDFCDALVKTLDDNPDCGWAKCDAILADEDGAVLGYRVSRQAKPEISNDFIRFIAELDTVDAWIIMARTEYLKKCLPGLSIAFADSHEYHLALTMSYYGNFSHIPQILYHNIRHAGSGYYRSISSYQSSAAYYDKYLQQVTVILKQLPLSDQEYERYITAFKFRTLRLKEQLAVTYNEEEIVEKLTIELTTLVKTICPDANISYIEACFELTCIVLQDYLLGIPLPSSIKISKITDTDFVIYGAGMKCLENLPTLLELGLTPIEIWDKGALEGSTVADIPLRNVPTLQNIGIKVVDLHSERLKKQLKEQHLRVVIPFNPSINKHTPIMVMLNTGPLEKEVIANLNELGYTNIINYSDSTEYIKGEFIRCTFPNCLKRRFNNYGS